MDRATASISRSTDIQRVRHAWAMRSQCVRMALNPAIPSLAEASGRWL